jgi:hypothetical protein
MANFLTNASRYRSPQSAVIPAKAGIHSYDSAFPEVCRVDSRFRGNDLGVGGNDWGLEAGPGASDTITRRQFGFTSSAVPFRASRLSR